MCMCLLDDDGFPWWIILIILALLLILILLLLICCWCWRRRYVVYEAEKLGTLLTPFCYTFSCFMHMAVVYLSAIIYIDSSLGTT